MFFFSFRAVERTIMVHRGVARGGCSTFLGAMGTVIISEWGQVPGKFCHLYVQIYYAVFDIKPTYSHYISIQCPCTLAQKIGEAVGVPDLWLVARSSRPSSFKPPLCLARNFCIGGSKMCQVCFHHRHKHEITVTWATVPTTPELSHRICENLTGYWGLIVAGGDLDPWPPG